MIFCYFTLFRVVKLSYGIRSLCICVLYTETRWYTNNLSTMNNFSRLTTERVLCKTFRWWMINTQTYPRDRILCQTNTNDYGFLTFKTTNNVTTQAYSLPGSSPPPEKNRKNRKLAVFIFFFFWKPTDEFVLRLIGGSSQSVRVSWTWWAVKPSRIRRDARFPPEFTRRRSAELCWLSFARLFGLHLWNAREKNFEKNRLSKVQSARITQFALSPKLLQTIRTHTYVFTRIINTSYI